MRAMARRGANKRRICVSIFAHFALLPGRPSDWRPRFTRLISPNKVQVLTQRQPGSLGSKQIKFFPHTSQIPICFNVPSSYHPPTISRFLLPTASLAPCQTLACQGPGYILRA
ncbi:hypothetical protein CIHG_00872 [Coccidioides immitis H538.4]|uniref:Uncharacterized protein n=1 Tax=Coccidioides immitis H538.4 TaxID=396776 RepID=A0A0J8RD20_COCIT|nr:hypothetical protein CIHG_00872 [Coccidioides immitis H538.4]